MERSHEQLLQKFAGCDAWEDDPPAKGSIWLFGIEHGFPKDEKVVQSFNQDETYSIATQRKSPFNRNAFKLLTVMSGRPVAEWVAFAEEHQPFVRGKKGYFKGNLYPYPCYGVGDWPEDAQRLTGFASKAEYLQWCREFRLPVIKSWVDEYRPSLIIGVGQRREDFSLAAFGRECEFRTLEADLVIKGKSVRKWLHLAEEGGLKLVVAPHLSRGLHENASLEWAGAQIRQFMGLK